MQVQGSKINVWPQCNGSMIKSSSWNLHDPIRKPTHAIATLFLMQLPACNLGSSRRLLTALGSCTWVEELEKASGSWLWMGSTLLQPFWRVNQWKEGISLFLSVNLICASNTNKKVKYIYNYWNQEVNYELFIKENETAFCHV